MSREEVINEIMKLDEEQAELLLQLLVNPLERIMDKRYDKEHSKQYIVNNR